MAAPIVPFAFPNGVNPGEIRAFLTSGARHDMLMGGAGSGKSEGALVKILLYGFRFGRTRNYVGQPVLKECKETTIPHFWEIVERAGAQNMFVDWCPVHKFTNRDPPRVTAVNGSTWTFMGFNQETGLGSLEAGCVLCSEAFHPLGGRNMPRRTFNAIQKGARSRYAPFRQIILETNPPPRSHWLHDTFGEDGRPGFALHRVSLEDNEHNLPVSHVRSIKEEFTGALYEVMVRGNWGDVIEGQPAFPVYTPAWHESELPIRVDPNYPLWRSWDFGFHHPFVTWHQIVDLPFGFKQWRIIRCVNPKSVMIDQLWATVEIETALLFEEAGKELLVHDCGDPAAKQRSDKGVTIEFLRQKGIKLMARPTRPIEEGVQGIHEWMTASAPGHEPCFLVSSHPSCEPVREACGHGFQRAVDREGRGVERFVDDGYFKDCIDTLRYAELNALGNPRAMTEDPITPENIASYSSRTTEADLLLREEQGYPFAYGRNAR